MSYYSFLPKLINMSLTASVAIILVILLRLLLRKAPKVISYALWGVVLFRLLCPVSIGSDFSVYNLFDAPTEESGTVTSVIEYIPSDIVHTEYPTVTLPVPGISDTINESLPQGEEQLRADPLEGPLFIATCLWITGVAVMIICSMVSFVKLRRKLLVVVPLRDNIFIADDIKSPFVVGFFRPKIYLPCNLSEKELEYIILHEQHHIKRFDHIVKLISFIALSIHWFNPLVWLSFTLAAKDMEMSCDEAVIRKVGSHVRADYSASLLTLATGQRIIAGAPLAFGEGDTKGRIHNLSKWKKPAVWVVALAVVACIVLAIGLLTNPNKLTIYDIFDQDGYSVMSQEQVNITLYVEKSKLPDSIYTAEGHEFKPNEVLAYSTETSRIYLHKAMVSNESDDLLYLIFDCAYDLPESGSFVSPYQYTEESDSTLSTLHLRSNDLRDSNNTTYQDALNMRGHGPGSQFAFYVSKEACMAAEGTLMIDVVCTQIEYARSGHGYDSQQTSSSQVRNPWVQEYIPGAEGIIGNVDKEKFESISEDFAIGADQYGHAVFKDPHKAFDTFVVLFADGIALIQEQNDLAPISRTNYSAYKKFGWQVDYGLVETQKQAAFVTSFLDIYENSFATEVPSASTEIPSTAPTSIIDITDPTKKKGFSYDAATEKFFEDETYDYLFRGIYSQYVIVQYADGTTEDIVTALNSGKASIADLDRFGIHYLAEPRADSLDAAIRTAILEHNRYFNTLFHCASFVPLQQVELSFDSDPPQPNQVTVYGMALHYAFRPFGSGFRRTSGSHGPVAITFEVENGKYSLMEYWEAGKGENYVSSVRNKFPDEIEDAALDTTKFIDAQMQECYAQAAAFWNSDTTAAIEELFTIIESSPLQSSNPGDYINEHPLEYRELTYYGQFTLRYCFEQFLKGGQIGLRGHLMRAVIDDIAPESRLQIQTMTGQEYFDAWKDAAIQLSEQHGMDWIKVNQPAVYILLQMMREYVIDLDQVSALVSEKGYTGEDFKEELLGQFNKNIIYAWGKPDFDISGFGSQLGHPGWAQIWYLDEENHQRITLYLNEKGYVEEILIDTTENN